MPRENNEHIRNDLELIGAITVLGVVATVFSFAVSLTITATFKIVGFVFKKYFMKPR